MVLTFRPHHFMCTLGFQGKGYNPNFVNNFIKIKTNLSDESVIEIVNTADDICAPCPHKRDESCAKQAKITLLDQRHAKELDLKPGAQLTWAQAKARMAKLSLERFHAMCKGCSWKDLGICEKALIKLRG